MSAWLWLGWPAPLLLPSPCVQRGPGALSCCRPTETIAVTQHTRCSKMAASSDLMPSHWGLQSLGPHRLLGKNPAGWVAAQTGRAHLGRRTDLHVLAPRSSHSAHWQGGLTLWFSFFFFFLFFLSPPSCLYIFKDGYWLELLCVCLELDGQTSASLWGWGEHQQPNRHCFRSCFYFQKPTNLMVEPVPSEEG